MRPRASLGVEDSVGRDRLRTMTLEAAELPWRAKAA